MTNDRLEVPRDAILDGSNFTDWKMVIESVLQQHKLQNYVFKELKEEDKFKSEALTAKTFLLFSMNREHRNKINHCTTPYEIWMAISNIYENKSKRAANTLWKRLFNYRITSLDNVSQGISEMQTIVSDLRARDIKVDTSCLVGCIECALPSEFNEWLINWSMRESEPTLNELINSISNHVETLKSSEAKAMIASKSNPRPTKQSDSDNAAKFCKYCKKPNHDISECRKLKRKKAEQNQSSSSKHDKPAEKNFLMMAITQKQEKSSWLADSGCSLHMTNNISWIHDYRKLTNPISIRLGDDHVIKALGFGYIQTSNGKLQNVHYVPEISHNLFSISSATNHGVEVNIKRDAMSFSKDNQEITRAIRVGSVYTMQFNVILPDIKTCASATLDEWHKRFAHISSGTIQKMIKNNSVNGLDIGTNNDQPCEECAINKCQAVSHPSRTSNKAPKPGLVLHADTTGPASTTGIDGQRFVLLCKDEYSGFRMTSCIKQKSEIPEELMRFISQTELETGNRPLKLVTDQGSEYLNARLSNFLKENAILHQLSAKYTPQQNGFVEREFQTLIGSARTLLNSAKLPQQLWPESVYTANYVLNRSLASNKEDTPYELWHGIKPNVRNLKIFGQHAIIRKDRGFTKFEERGEKGIFVGYTNIHNTFRFFEPIKKKIIISCNVKFLDTFGSFDKMNGEQVTGAYTPISVPLTKGPLQSIYANVISSDHQEGESIYSDMVYSNDKGDRMSSTPKVHINIPPPLPKSNIKFTPAPGSSNKRRDDVYDVTNFITADGEETLTPEDTSSPMTTEESGTQIVFNPNSDKRGKKFQTFKRLFTASANDNVANACVVDMEDPHTFKQAMSRQDAKLWMDAMQDELASLERCNVWELVDRPDDNVVSCRWVFKTKRNPDNEVERYRARLVARGFTQEKGKDYFETYSPVCDTSAIRFLFAIAALKKLTIKQFDVKAAFLYGELNETVYVEQPPGFDNCKSKVYRLKKALYGLKQASKQWSIRFSSYLKSLGFEQSFNDDCIFYKFQPLVILAIYVDDAIILSEDPSSVDQLIVDLRKEFEIHLVDSNIFLGFQYVVNQDHSIFLHQTSYVKKVVNQYNMNDANPVTCPGTEEKTDENGEPLPSPPLGPTVPFREAIGSLLYAAGTTRFDIMHAVIVAARACDSPTESDWTKVKRIIRYLKGTSDFGITYRPGSDDKIKGFCDASFANNRQFKSTTGYIFSLANGPIAWKSKKQSITTTSSTESEFVSLCSTTKEAVWLRNLAIELSIMSEEPINIYCDNTSSIRIAENEKAAKRTRHLGAQIHYPKEQAEKGIIKVNFIPGKQQPADMMTKPLGPILFVPNRDRYMAKLLLHTLTVLCLFGSIHSYRFQTVEPILYDKLDNEVTSEITEYIYEYTFINPCKQLNNLDKKFWALTLYESNHAFGMRNQCENAFNDEWLKIVKQISRLTPPHSHQVMELHRKKRGIFKDVTLGVSGFALGYTTSNFIKSVFSFLGFKSEEEKELEIINDHLGRIDQRISEFERYFNITKHFNTALLTSIQKLAQDVSRNTQEIERLKNQLPRLSWAISYIQSKLSRASSALSGILHSYHQGQVATGHMSRLLNITDFLTIDDESTMMNEISLIGSDTIRFHFFIRASDPNVNVVNVRTFSHWTHVESHPRFIEYAGNTFAIYNRTNSCIKGIEQPTRKFVLDECLIPGFVDKRLNQWRTATIDMNRTIPYLIENMKLYPNFNYIYCYLDNITFSSMTLPCPAEVFKLSANISFETGTKDLTYTPRKFNRFAGKVIGLIQDDIHPAHYVVSTGNYSRFTEELRNLKEINESFNSSIIHQTTRYVENYPLRTSAGFITCTIAFVLVIYGYRFYQRLTQVMSLQDPPAPPLPPKMVSPSQGSMSRNMRTRDMYDSNCMTHNAR